MKLSDITPLQPKLIEQQLDEINMSPTSLKQLASKINARAGMEFEMIVPGASTGDEDDELEPDYSDDQRTRSFSDIEEFFNDGDYNSRGEVQRLIEKLQEAYFEWESEKIDQDWQNDGEDYVRDYINNNEWIQEDKVREHLEAMGLDEEGIDAAFTAYNKAPTYNKSSELKAAREADENYNNYIEADRAADEELEELVSETWGNQSGLYDEAFAQYREENQGSADEGDFLEDARYRYMSDISSEFNINWPHWQSSGGDGDGVSAEEVAEDFAKAIGRTVQASGAYHSGSVERPDASNSHYVVEPDGSLDADVSSDRGLEFVSPALPIGELLSDLDKVAKWASIYGCYTNKSTGLHINVSVEGWSGDIGKLDYVKLALLMGDKYILEKFGRTGNTYCKSAMEEIKTRVGQRPEDAGALLQKMKTGLDGLASKSIHSGATAKFTSINTKDGYVEFRSPGGDWLGEYAANPGTITDTLLRFVVALDAAVDPEKYKQEYLKKLYAILQPKSQNDTMAYFAKYAAGELPKAALKSFVRQAQLERQGKKPEAPEQEPNWYISDSDTGQVYHKYYAANSTDAFEYLQRWKAQSSAHSGGDHLKYGKIMPGQEPGTPAAPAGGGEFTGQWIIKDGEGRELYKFGGVGNVQSDANRVALEWIRRNAPNTDLVQIEVVPEMR